jgi:endonuclease III
MPRKKPAPAAPIDEVMQRLIAAYPGWNAPVVIFMGQVGDDPFRVLIATLISLRTKDEVTGPASQRLFARAASPQEILSLDEAEIARLIYPAGFYKTKARTIRTVCRELLDRYDGRIPDTVDELLTLPGVGRKTANLVVAAGHHKPALCVDTHVHRITNRWGYVSTTTPDETEFALRAQLAAPYWQPFNSHLVALGQTICKPISPTCSGCPLDDLCPKVNVGVRR